ncbi:unnamed protein product [Paramecium octaurelia]|uniref:Uncharacterized protein n=1 Tax=Paramecium octaurelia TaxID=43137 RepID=A0A8S1YMN7_PAROT|nr:unnamed protein product [Paramecium octaurelia]
MQKFRNTMGGKGKHLGKRLDYRKGFPKEVTSKLLDGWKMKLWKDDISQNIDERYLKYGVLEEIRVGKNKRILFQQRREFEDMKVSKKQREDI